MVTTIASGTEWPPAGLVPVEPCRGLGHSAFRGPVEDWGAWLAIAQPAEEVEQLRKCTSTGRPCGDKGFVQRLSELTGRVLGPKPRGRKPNVAKETGAAPSEVDLFGD